MNLWEFRQILEEYVFTFIKHFIFMLFSIFHLYISFFIFSISFLLKSLVRMQTQKHVTLVKMSIILGVFQVFKFLNTIFQEIPRRI